MSIEFLEFRHFILHIDGVTMVGPEHAPVVGVETEEHAILVRKLLHPSMEIVVTGSLVVDVQPAPVPREPDAQIDYGEFPDFSSLFGKG